MSWTLALSPGGMLIRAGTDHTMPRGRRERRRRSRSVAKRDVECAEEVSDTETVIEYESEESSRSPSPDAVEQCCSRTRRGACWNASRDLLTITALSWILVDSYARRYPVFLNATV